MTTGLTTDTLILDAGAALCTIADHASDTPLSTNTPCHAWDLESLVRHLLFYAPVLAASARRSTPPPGPAIEDIVLESDWAAQLATAVDDVAAAWGEPAAWSGMTTMAGSDPMPAPMIGGMVLGELVVHGWDLAVTARIEPAFPEAVLVAAEAAVIQMAELGRGMGIFGPAVAVAPDAPLLDRIVALTGRNPDGGRPTMTA